MQVSKCTTNTKITAQALQQAQAVANIRRAWLCRNKEGIVIAVKSYRAEASDMYRRGECADFYCALGPCVFTVVA